MTSTTYHRVHPISLFLFLIFGPVIAIATSSTERPATSRTPGSPSLLLLAIHGNKRTAASLGRSKPLVQVAETPPKPLPQIMLPRNMTAEALKPPLGAALAPPPKRLVDMDVCRGYYDVMGQYDFTFNCSKDTFIYCCGTCHYRFCCQHRSNRLDQNSCNNYDSPVWANTPPPATIPLDHRPDPGFDPLRQQSNNTVYVIGGVISFTLAVAVGIKVAFHKASRRPRHRDINVPRALVDILRHQSSPVQQGERNNSVALGSGVNEGTLGRAPKNLYTPGVQSKDNRKRVPRMNNAQLASSGTLLSSKHNNTSAAHPSFHHSLHNLAQLPPSYETAMKPEINRYCSLKRLEKDLDEYSGYYTSKRRPNNAPPSFHSSQHHLHWGSRRGTWPCQGMGVELWAGQRCQGEGLGR
ncbi:hypothetical protein ANANG_G00006990 [Anguilla anguilla]|uniref:Shisa N-terminal domain-containing protein n=1 Tax=Anguilla anguilla TaxID=7936 RepID=A0A9D3MZ32_ANGAN|nr:hypothetical protein ANANG_G00006990 [Anguilla anguilla]